MTKPIPPVSDAPSGAQEREQKEDHGVELIHQAIPDVEGTEPRLNSDEPESEREYADDAGGCSRCDGSGVILICCDDMCHGAGECMHGDGEIICPVCGGRE